MYKKNKTMSTWVNKSCLSFFQLFCVKVLVFLTYSMGRVPKHVAFIMDGNRRYATKLGVNSSAGHSKGFDKLSECIQWCINLGISELTVYAFSIENFKRPKEEVDALMDISRDKFKRLLDEIDQINERGIRVVVPGRLSLLPDDVRILAYKAMLATRYNNILRLNIAYAYTGRDEISRAASCIVDSVHNKELSADDIDDDLVSQALDLGAPDLLIRTSGEVRLSDFMLWQVSNSVLYFTNELWPELKIWNFLVAIIHFCKHAPPLQQNKKNNPVKHEFLKNLENRKLQELEKIIGC